MTSKPWLLPLSKSVIVGLPLPPSTNQRMGVVSMGGQCRQILTRAARQYIDQASTWLSLQRQRVKVLEDYRPVAYWVILPRTNCDGHNYGKIAWDALEAGGWTVNDKYILAQLRGIYHDAKEPSFVFEWSKQ